MLRRLEAPVVGAMNFSFRNVPLYKAAEIAVVQQRQLLLDARATVLLNEAQTYDQVVISTQQVSVLEHSLALQQARLADLRVASGPVSPWPLKCHRPGPTRPRPACS